MDDVKEIKINITDFPQKSSILNEYGLCGLDRQLYEFFHSNVKVSGKTYLFEYPDYLTLSQYIYLDMQDAYAKYGFYTEEGLREEKLIKVEIIPANVFISDFESFRMYLEEKYSPVPEVFADVHFVIEVPENEQKVFLDNLNHEVRHKYSELTKKYTFLNIYSKFLDKKDISLVLKEDAWYKNWNLKNMLDLLIKHDCLSERTDYDAIIRSYKCLLDDCLKIVKDDPKTCFYFDESPFNYAESTSVNMREKFNTFYNNYYPFIAAYLKLNGVMCYVAPNSERNCRHGMLNFFSRDNLYLSDYLETLRHPIMVGVLNPSSNGFHMIAKRNTTEPLSLNFNVRCVKVEENVDEKGLKRLCVIDDDVLKINCNDRDVQVLDFRNYYDLHTKDFKKGREESALLGLLLFNIHAILEIKDAPLDVSNALLFKMRDNIYVGIVDKIDYKVSYVAESLIKGYNYKDVVEFDEAKYTTQLVDIRAYDDHSRLVGNPKLLQRKMPNTSEGFLVSLLCHTAANIRSACNLYYDDVALFGIPTKACRGQGAIKLFKCGLPIKGLQNSFLTFFGGPHMYLGETVNGVRTPLIINQNLWRQ